MITREQALQLRHGDELHYGVCQRIVGPRGGVRYQIERWRVSGMTKTWKTRPEAFEVPIKYGLRGHSYLAGYNAHLFHLATECPLLKYEAHDDQELYADQTEAIRADRQREDQ